MRLSAINVQNIFHHQHILIVNSPLQDEGFSVDTLQKYANVDKKLGMVGKYLCLSMAPLLMDDHQMLYLRMAPKIAIYTAHFGNLYQKAKSLMDAN
jgi:uncharacterized membrane protein